MTAFDSKRGHEQLGIVVHVIQIWPFYFTKFGHFTSRASETIAKPLLFSWNILFGDVLVGDAIVFCLSSLSIKPSLEKRCYKHYLRSFAHLFYFPAKNVHRRYLQGSMDARRVVAFLFLCFSTGYCLKNDDVDDEVLDMLQETENLKEAPDMVSCDASHMLSSYLSSWSSTSSPFSCYGVFCCLWE